LHVCGRRKEAKAHIFLVLLGRPSLSSTYMATLLDAHLCLHDGMSLSSAHAPFLLVLLLAWHCWRGTVGEPRPLLLISPSIFVSSFLWRRSWWLLLFNSIRSACAAGFGYFDVPMRLPSRRRVSALFSSSCRGHVPSCSHRMRWFCLCWSLCCGCSAFADSLSFSLTLTPTLLCSPFLNSCSFFSSPLSLPSHPPRPPCHRNRRRLSISGFFALASA